jgi:hypothetical protein
MILALAVLASFVLGQEAEPVAAPASPKDASTAAAAPMAPITLAPDATGNVSAEQVRAFLLQAEEKDLENEKRLRDYTYLERQVEHKLDGHGNVAKTEVRTSEILEIYGEQVEKLIAKDDKPLSAEEAKKEDDKLQKVIDRRKNESEDDRRKRVEKEEKRREEGRKFVLEVADAFNFRLVGSELIDGHDTWVLDGEPRPVYEPKRREAKFLSKFRGRVWIDKAEAQWVKLDITAIDTIAFGLFLARIHKGAHVLVEQTRVNDEVWLPKHIELRVDARVALVKNYREEIELTFRDYKKFRAETRITVVGETN